PVNELAEDGCEWDLFVHDLAGLLHNLVLIAAPERISVGGGVTTSREWLFPRMRAILAKNIGNYGSFAGYAEQLEHRLGPPGLSAMAGPLGALATGLQALGAAEMKIS